MKQKFVISLLILLNFISSCSIRTNKNAKIGDCISSFEYFNHDAVGPESLVSIVQINDSYLKEILSRNPRLLVYKYTGGIYNIDTLYFPRPQIEINNYKDSSFIFDQSVFELRQYPKSFIDSIMKLTERSISIEIIDTLSNKKWNLKTCN